MHKTFTLYAGLLCIFFTGTVAAQSFTISGTVTGNDGKIVAGATATLLNASDSSWVQSEITADNGSFILDEVTAGNYLVAITAIGYEQKEQHVTISDKDVTVNITTERNSQVLNEVTITGNKPLIEREPGKTIINVSSEKAAGENILDLLRKLPGVNVSSAGEVSMAGKQAVLVLVNGKQTYLSGEDLANYLRSMSAEQVAQVELMSQPSAKYDAEGNAGIIDIKVKKNKKEGLSGTATAKYAQSRFWGTSENLRVNYKKNKTGVMLNAGYYNFAGFLEQNTDRNFRNPNTGTIVANFQQETYLKERFLDYSAAIDVEQQIGENTNISLHADGLIHPNQEVDVSEGKINDYKTGMVTYNEFINNQGFVRYYHNLAAHADYKIKEGHDLTADADYLNYNIPHTQDMTNRNYDAQMQPIPGAVELRGEQPVNITVYSAKTDYAGKINEKTKLEAGLKTSIMSTRYGVFFDVNDNGTWRFDSSRSNDFLYDENINSVYLSCNRTLGKKLETKLGLRAEQTNVAGVQKVTNTSFDRTYFSLFPTAFLSYKMNDDYYFEINVGRRIQRPEHRQLNPRTNYNSQYKYSVGNQFLKPTYSTNVELTANYKNMLNATAEFRSVHDVISYVARQDNSTYVYYVMPENISKFTEQQFGLTFNKELYKWWETAATVYGFGIQYDGVYNSQQVDVSGWGYGLNCSGTFRLGNQWKTSYWMNFNGKSRETAMAVADSNIYYGISVSKKILHDTTLVKLDIIDPFRVYDYRLNVRLQDIDTQIYNRYNTTSYALTVSYDFGKQLDRMRSINNASDGTGRMKM